MADIGSSARGGMSEAGLLIVNLAGSEIPAPTLAARVLASSTRSISVTGTSSGAGLTAGYTALPAVETQAMPVPAR